jgi:phosphoesterase RecJ-like protein
MDARPNPTAGSRTLDPGAASALELLKAGRRFLLCGHVRPDGDCLGSEAALARVLAKLGKSVEVVNPDPIDPRFAYLEEACAFQSFKSALPDHDVAVLLDFCEIERTGPMAAPLRRAASKKVVVDHHISHGAAWWDAAFVDSTASATGVLVRRVADALGVPVDAAAAKGVFTSLVTDTGWFKYSNTDAETLRVAAEMVALGANPNAIYAALNQTRPKEHPLFIGRLLTRAEFLADDRLAIVDLPLSEGFASEQLDSDEVLDILRSVATVEVVLYLRELPDGTCKLSARSKGAYDVNALARTFGGGGHKKASGATLKGTLAAARARVVEAALAGFHAGSLEGAGQPDAR